MTTVFDAIGAVIEAQRASTKPLAIVLAGHNGSGKSTFWHEKLAPELRVPLVNADRMMLSILPETLPPWAVELRDHNETWMWIAQQGVQAFVAQAMMRGAPFAMETVFSHWRPRGDGTFESKIELIEQMKASGYFVLLVFVGLANAELSVARVSTRVQAGGHDVAVSKLLERFPRTQHAIREAVSVADAALLADNSRAASEAFTPCVVQVGGSAVYDIRTTGSVPSVISQWLDVVRPS